VVQLGPGTQIKVVESSDGWALIAREGKKIGYVEEKLLAKIQ
jgi:parvulin-like peptidyl-prolyl isomerase